MMQKLLAFTLLFFTLLTTGLWKDLSNALFEPLTYEQQRQVHGFEQIPLDLIRQKTEVDLDHSLPIKLSETLQKNDFLQQRITEVFYPRRFSSQAAHELILTNNEFLQGPLAPSTEPVREQPTELAFFHFLICTALFLGVGFFISNFYVSENQSLSKNILYAMVVSGVLGSFWTWLQLPYFFVNFACIGAIGLVFQIKNYKKINWHRPELLVLGACFFILFLLKAFYPVTLWDGRSIWFFHTKQFFINGMLSLKDLKDPAYFFAHPSYPLLIPSSFSFFSFLEKNFNERMASLGVVVVYAGLLGCFFEQLLKSLKTRAVKFPELFSAALTACIFLATEHMVSGGYVDSYVSVLLGILFLAWIVNHDPRTTFFVVLAVSLIKVEGSIFSFLILSFGIVIQILRHKKISKNFFILYTALLPALFHQIWLRLSQIHDYTSNISFITTLTSFPSKLGAMLSGIGSILISSFSFQTATYTQSSSLVVLGFLCFAVFIFKFKRTRKEFSFLVLVFLIFITSLFSLAAMPYDIEWLSKVTLDRLLLHSAIISMTLPFLN